MRRVVVEASFADAQSVVTLCEQTGARLGISPYEAPFAHPIVNDDLLGPVPERVWAIVEQALMARGAALESQVVAKRRPSVLIVHRNARMRSSLVAAFSVLGADAVALVDPRRALTHLGSIGADLLVSGSEIAGVGGEDLIALARAKSDRLRVCALVGGSSAVADLTFDPAQADAEAIARNMLERWTA